MVTTRTFNSPGQLLTESFSGGALNDLIVSNRHDQFLRRTNLSILDSPSSILASTSYTYDEANRLRSVSIGSSSMTYDYLANSPLVENIWFTNSGTRVLVVTNFHDKLNRLTNKVWGGSSGVLASYAYQYNSAHQRTRMDMAGSSYSSPTYWLYEYDSLGQVISAKRYWSDGSVVAGQQNLFSFDDIGNRTYAAWGGDQWGANLRYENYTANVLNQITQRTVPPYVQTLGEAATNATVTLNNVWTTRKGTYWRGEVSVDNSSAAQWVTLTNLSVIQQPGTNLDLVTNIIGTLAVPQTTQTFSYDADGNLTNDGIFSYRWDANNRLTRVESLSSTPTAYKRQVDSAYDSNDRRIEKIVSTNSGIGWVGQYTNRFLYDGWNLVAILDEQSTLLHTFIWGTDLSGTMRGAGGVGGLLAWVIHSGTYAGTYFYTQDGNGNITRVVRASDGSVMAEYEYDPFGRLLRATGPLAMINPFRFSSKYTDDETGLVYYGYRYYNPETGTWLSRDPVGEFGGINVFSFLANDSINFNDVDGLQRGGAQGLVNNATVAFPGMAINPLELLQMLGGLPFSTISGDLFSNHIQEIPHDTCNIMIFVNGVSNTRANARQIHDALLNMRRYNGAFGIAAGNPTTYAGDLIQIIGDEFKFIQHASIHLARQIMMAHEALQRNGCCCGRIQVAAHSQGTKVAQQAFRLLRPDIKRIVCYTGFGGETRISPRGFDTLPENYRNTLDPVPYAQFANPLNYLDQPFIETLTRDASGHSFFPNYRDWIASLPANCPCSPIPRN